MVFFGVDKPNYNKYMDKYISVKWLEDILLSVKVCQSEWQFGGTVDNSKCTVIGSLLVTQQYVSPLFAPRDVGFDKHYLQLIWQVDKVNAHTQIIKCIW